MNYATHILHPQQKMGSPFVKMLCGRIKHSKNDTFKTSENLDEVTCIGCLGYKDNPARILRQYGHVRLIPPYGFALIPAWGYHIYIIAFSTDVSGNYWRYMAKTDFDTKHGVFEALTFKNAIESIINIIETKILKPDE